MALRHRHGLWRLTAAAAVAVLVPTAAASLAKHRIESRLEPAWKRALGENLSVESVHASLTGAVRLDGVQVAGIFRADAIVGAVGLDNLLQGRLSADEITLVAPQIRDRLHRGQESRIASMLSRLAARRSRVAGEDTTGSSRPTRLRRIVVNDGQLRVDLFDGGRVVADRVELVPTQQGVRVVTGSLALSAQTPEIALSGQFERMAADVALPNLVFSRILAVGGRFDVEPPGSGRRGASFDEVVAAVGVTPDRLAFASGHAVDAGDRARFELAARIDGTIDASMADTPLSGLAGLAPVGLDLSDAVASGSLHIQPWGLRGASRMPTVAVTGELAVRGALLSDPALSQQPLPLDGTLAGTVALSRATDGFVVDLRDLAVQPETGVPDSTDDTVRPVELALGGVVEFDARGVPRRADARVELRRTRCMQALLAIPTPARARLAGLDLRGDASASVRFAFDREAPENLVLDIDIDVGDCEASHEPREADPRLLLRPFSYQRADGSSALLAADRPGYRDWKSIPSLVAKTFVAAEDARFFEHNGFDAEQIRRSLGINLSQGELLRGGSTISQQLVKNLFLTRERTLARKLEEAVLTWRLEQRLDKPQILERYLNIVELGPGVYGVDSGARHWFGRPLRRLEPREVAFLAALTPAPTTLSRRIEEAGGIDKEMRERVDVILRAMAREGVIRRSVLNEELDRPLRLDR